MSRPDGLAVDRGEAYLTAPRGIISCRVICALAALIVMLAVYGFVGRDALRIGRMVSLLQDGLYSL